MAKSKLVPVTIDGRRGLLAYLDDRLRLTTKEQATMAKVVFDDGSQTFLSLATSDQG